MIGETIKDIKERRERGTTPRAEDVDFLLNLIEKRPTNSSDWVEQYDETVKELLETAEALEGKSGKVSKAHARKLFRQAADDIKILVDGLLINERLEKEKRPQANEDGMVPIPDKYLPKGVGGSALDPTILRAHISALYRTSYPRMHTMETKPWVILYLLDRAGL